MNEHNKLREAALRYAEEYGKQLKQENASLQNTEYSTPRLDAKVKKLTTRKLRFTLGAVGSLAAALLIFAVLTIPNRINESSSPSADKNPSDSYAPIEAPADSYAPAVLPLNFTLPKNYEIIGSEQDYGKSVYYLGGGESVTLTMETPKTPTDYSALKAIRLPVSNADVKCVSNGDYNLIAFELDGIEYELSCKYEINTLIELAESIL